MAKFWKEIIAVLILIIIFLLCINSCENKDCSYSTETKIDTVYIPVNKLVFTKPTIVKSISPTKKEVETRFLPDKEYEKLLQQYNSLAELYLTQNIQKDSIPIDTYGFVKIIDTISENYVKGRRTEFQLKIPEITKTVTIIPEKKREFYFGGELQSTEVIKFNQVSSKLLYKTKKDKIYGLSLGIGNNREINYGLSYYWKLN